MSAARPDMERADVERDAVRFGEVHIPYRVQRSARRTVSLVMQADEGLLVKAPRSAEPSALRALVHRKAPWVLARQARFDQLEPAPPAREFVSGEALRYLGRQLRLRVVEGGPERALVVARGSVLVAQVAEGMGAAERAVEVREGLERWYRARAQARLPERVERAARALGVSPPPVLIRGQQKRWGSCTASGELRFNWRIMMGAMPLVDYVVAHELCHLLVHDHSPAFYDKLRALMPDYAAREERLRLEGPRFKL